MRALCDLSCQSSRHLSSASVRPDKEGVLHTRGDPIHLGAAIRQCEGAIRRTKRRRQWAEIWKPRSGSALAEIGRLSASECPSKVRNRRTGPRGWWPEPKGKRVGSPDSAVGDGDSNSRRIKGRSRPDRNSRSGNRVSPIRPASWRKSIRKDEMMAEGGKESRRKRRPRCNGRDRARMMREIPDPKGCSLPAGLSGSDGTGTSVPFGDVRW